MPALINGSKFNLESPELEAQLQALVGPPGVWKARRDLQLALLGEFGLTEQTRFLDLGCGSLRLGVPLIDYLDAGHYTGIDIDPKCIAAAEKMVDYFGLHQKSPKIFRSENFGFNELRGAAKFDMIWIFQVFIHLSDEHVRNAMKAISALLAAGGATYGSVFVNEQLETLTQKGHWRHYPEAHGPLSYYKDRAAETGLAFEALGVIGKDGWTKPPRQPPHLTMIKITPS